MTEYLFTAEIYDGTKVSEVVTEDRLDETCARYANDVDYVWWDYEENESIEKME